MQALIAMQGVLLCAQPLTLEAIWQKHIYTPRSHYLNKGEGLWGYEDERGALYRFVAPAPAETLRFQVPPIYYIEAKEPYALLYQRVKGLYRHSALHKLHFLNETGLQAIEELYREAAITPQGQVILADGQNLYFWTPSESKPQKLTFYEGAQQAGITDWLYEEEFGFTRAFEVSPSGEWVAYLLFDNTHTPTWSIPDYSTGKLYPAMQTFPYPKAGQPNPRIALHLYSLRTREDKVLYQDTTDGYIPLLFWSEMGDELYFVHLNRLQNRLTLYHWDARTTQPQVFFRDSTPYWFSSDNRHLFVQRTDQPEFFYKAERGQAPLIERYDYKGRRLAQYLIPGLKDMIGYAQGKLFFTAWGQDPTAQRIGYLALREKAPKPRWVTTDTLWAEAQLSQRLLAITESTPLKFPRTYILDVATLMKRYDLPDLNANLRKVLPPLQIRFFQFVNRSGDSLWASLLLPPDFDPKKRYPVLLRFYGGPGSQMVSRGFGGTWFAWEARLVQKGFLVAHMDGRGTALYDPARRYAIYKRLGSLETADLIDFITHLRRQPFVEKVYAMGWSFGGYLAARLAMEAPPDALAGAISIAPVTGWYLYDSAYTERFMQTPKDNPQGYEETSLLEKNSRLSAPLLLIHGEADDNVHVQNTYLLIDYLVMSGADNPLTWIVYPGQNHGIGRYRLSLFKEVERFIGVSP